MSIPTSGHCWPIDQDRDEAAELYTYEVLSEPRTFQSGKVQLRATPGMVLVHQGDEVPTAYASEACFLKAHAVQVEGGGE